ncbi:MAG: 30S ribosomal protein S27e [Candidatus Pacearchaeota archaeon]
MKELTRKVEDSNIWLTVKCKCGNVQVVYGKATTIVKCNKCSAILAEPRASRARIKARVLKIK